MGLFSSAEYRQTRIVKRRTTILALRRKSTGKMMIDIYRDGLFHRSFVVDFGLGG